MATGFWRPALCGVGSIFCPWRRAFGVRRAGGQAPKDIYGGTSQERPRTQRYAQNGAGEELSSFRPYRDRGA